MLLRPEYLSQELDCPLPTKDGGRAISELFTSGSGEPWRKLADETRSLAYDMKDEISKQRMLQIADDFISDPSRLDRKHMSRRYLPIC
jgi:hypothetical protein